MVDPFLTKQLEILGKQIIIPLNQINKQEMMEKKNMNLIFLLQQLMRVRIRGMNI